MVLLTRELDTHMRQLRLFPDETFKEGDQVQFIKEGNCVRLPIGVEGTVISYDGDVFVEFTHYEGIVSFWCHPTQLQILS